MNRRTFILVLPLLPALMSAQTKPFLILKTDKDRFDDSLKLANDLIEDAKDMEVNLRRSVNLQRIREEDKLYAKIQSDRQEW